VAFSGHRVMMSDSDEPYDAMDRGVAQLGLEHLLWESRTVFCHGTLSLILSVKPGFFEFPAKTSLTATMSRA
jgi:hypothetical protein